MGLLDSWTPGSHMAGGITHRTCGVPFKQPPGSMGVAVAWGALPGERYPAPRGPAVPSDPQGAVGGQRYTLLVGFEPDE
jgi:hypothetical protein